MTDTEKAVGRVQEAMRMGCRHAQGGAPLCPTCVECLVVAQVLNVGASMFLKGLAFGLAIGFGIGLLVLL